VRTAIGCKPTSNMQILETHSPVHLCVVVVVVVVVVGIESGMLLESASSDPL
jgi:hypothetical protein